MRCKYHFQHPHLQGRKRSRDAKSPTASMQQEQEPYPNMLTDAFLSSLPCEFMLRQVHNNDTAHKIAQKPWCHFPVPTGPTPRRQGAWLFLALLTAPGRGHLQLRKPSLHLGNKKEINLPITLIFLLSIFIFTFPCLRKGWILFLSLKLHLESMLFPFTIRKDRSIILVSEQDTVG